MGNAGSSGRRRQGSRRSHPTPPPPAPPQPEIAPNRYVFAAATPYPPHYANGNPNPTPNPNPLQYYHHQYPPPPAVPVPLPAPYDHHHHQRGGGGPAHHPNWVGGRYPCGPMVQQPPPYVEHQKVVSIRNDVNVKKESLRIEADEENPGKFVASFTFDATADGCMTLVFFAKEGEDCDLIPTKDEILPLITVHFQQGLSQKFRQPPGTGIDFSMFEETELLRDSKTDIYPLAIKAEANPSNGGSEGNSAPESTKNSQITLITFEKDKDEFKARVLKQILWVNGMRYELQEIYGIGNSVDGDVDGNDMGKECVICLSEPRDTTVLPCRHMCMCSSCAKVLRFQTDKCPICRHPVERLLEIKVRNTPNE